LAPTAVPKGFVDARQVTEKIIGAIQIEEGDYRFGSSKACFHRQISSLSLQLLFRTQFGRNFSHRIKTPISTALLLLK
jgi:hypothetical protein